MVYMEPRGSENETLMSRIERRDCGVAASSRTALVSVGCLVHYINVDNMIYIQHICCTVLYSTGNGLHVRRCHGTCVWPVVVRIVV